VNPPSRQSPSVSRTSLIAKACGDGGFQPSNAKMLRVEPDLPQARSLAPLVVRALERLGGEATRREIIDTALELGDFSPAQRAVPSRHVRAGTQQPSELHHRLGWAISHAKNAGEIESVRLGVWRRVDVPG
jgi:hypothetical protein